VTNRLDRHPWRRFASVRSRATVAATLVVALALAFAALGLLALLRNRLITAERAAATLRAYDIAALAATGDLPAPLSFPGEDTGVAQVAYADGTVLVASTNLTGEPPIIDAQPSLGATVSVIRRGLPIGDNHRFVVVAVGATTPNGPATVYTAASLDRADDTLVAITLSLAIAYPLLLMVVAGTAYAAIGRALHPVEAIRAEVADIGEHDLHRRVPEPGSGDEIDRLAGTMNTMLARLERSADRHRRFVADASHELRSPLASLRTVLEVAAAHPDPATTQLTVEDALIDTTRLEALVADLLALARLDNPETRQQQRAVDLAALAQEVRERVDPGAVILTCTTHGPAIVSGDAVLLQRALRNMIDNAIRHARSIVTVTVQPCVGGHQLVVDDDGMGVPSADRTRIFERFTRLDEARARDDGGSGLGLAIVTELADALGGTVTVDDSPMGGARFVLTLRATDASIDLGAAPH
jgi:signal transduction histidine kinase